jgi:GT2 family glycosyltransferase
VVDNGSTDGSVEAIRNRFPSVSILELEKNLGYAAGNNAGIQYAMESCADYVMILNNDTIISSSMLSELVKFAESNQNAGMVGPKMYCYEPDNTIFATGSFINWSKGDTFNRGIFQPASKFDKYQNPEAVDYIVGCGVLVSSRLIKKIGVLDPDYYLNFEDVDWGLRAWREGFEVWYLPQAVMWHKISSTLGQASPANTYYMTRNALLFFWRNSSHRFRWLAISRILLRTIRSIVAWTFRPRYWSDAFKQRRKANIMALRDFTGGKFGQMKAK